MDNFFVRHPRFFETSHVGNWPIRLACRHEAIVETNRALFSGATVLDLASHDGRWSLAALDAGAAHVTGIEARPDLVTRAHENMAFYGVPKEKYRLEVGDLNHRLDAGSRYDLVLRLGYFYHTINQMALFEFVESTGAEHFILDGLTDATDGATIHVFSEPIADDAYGISASGIYQGNILVGHPGRGVLTMLLDHVGYNGTFYDWNRLIATREISFRPGQPQGPENPIGDYANGTRATLLARRRLQRLR